jgi:hypothetical protein
MKDFLPVEHFGPAYKTQLNKTNGFVSERLIFENDVLVARDTLSVSEKIPGTSILTKREELDAEGKLHGRVMDWNLDGMLTQETTFKHGVEHGVRSVYETPNETHEFPGEENYSRHLWEGEEIEQPAYWYRKNQEAIESRNPVKIIKALFASNDMTMQELNADQKVLKLQSLVL